MSEGKQLSFAEIMPEYPWEGQSAQEVLVECLEILVESSEDGEISPTLKNAATQAWVSVSLYGGAVNPAVLVGMTALCQSGIDAKHSKTVTAIKIANNNYKKEIS